MVRSLASPVAVLRPTWSTGGRHAQFATARTAFAAAAQKDGDITLFGDGEETRDHVHVDDVADLTLRCLVHRSAGMLNRRRELAFVLEVAQSGRPAFQEARGRS